MGEPFIVLCQFTKTAHCSLIFMYPRVEQLFMLGMWYKIEDQFLSSIHYRKITTIYEKMQLKIEIVKKLHLSLANQVIDSFLKQNCNDD